MSFFGTSNGSGSGSSDGLFFDTVAITRVKTYYNEKPEWASNPFDMAIEVFYNQTVGDKSWESSVLIKVHPKKDDLGRITNIPDGFKIGRLFEKAGMNAPEPTEDGKIPESALADLVGRSIRVVSYRNNRSTADKLRTSRWDIVGAADGSDDDYLREEFGRQNAKGYPKNYQKDIPSAAGAPEGAYVPDAPTPF